MTHTLTRPKRRRTLRSTILPFASTSCSGGGMEAFGSRPTCRPSWPSSAHFCAQKSKAHQLARGHCVSRSLCNGASLECMATRHDMWYSYCNLVNIVRDTAVGGGTVKRNVLGFPRTLHMRGLGPVAVQAPCSRTLSRSGGWGCAILTSDGSVTQPNCTANNDSRPVRSPGQTSRRVHVCTRR